MKEYFKLYAGDSGAFVAMAFPLMVSILNMVGAIVEPHLNWGLVSFISTVGWVRLMISDYELRVKDENQTRFCE